MSEQFVHLHTHTHYSLLDGAIKIPDLVQAALEYKMPAIGITDHGNMFGALEFYQACRKGGIKPIVGYEAYMAPNSRFDKDRENAKAYHLTMLAQNYTGYKNLMKLASEAYLNGFYYKPRIDKELLAQHCEGLIVFSGCLASEICRHLVAEDTKQAYETVDFYRDLFKDNFYVEIQENKIPEQTIANNALVEVSKKFEIPMVFTNDTHYLREGDAKPHDVLLCIQTGNLVHTEDRFRFGSQEFFLKSPKQMHHEARHYPGAATNTLVIAEKVDIEIPLGGMHIPKFETPEGKSNEEYLRELCEKGTKERYGKVTAEIRERLEHELRVINKMGFASYFLIVWDFINYARQNGIPVGPGRGSAAGSIVAYVLRITNLDPLKYRLIFERFLNEGRNEMPDIDIDFETERRGEVIEYVTNKYGKKNVAQIITFGTMAARAVIRDVGRAMDIPLYQVDEVAKKIPAVPKMTLEKALQEEEFKKAYKSDSQITELVDVARRLEGLNRQPGLHAAGVIIADDDLTEYCPLYKNVDGTVATQYSMGYMEGLGLLKMDFLGLNTLTLIQKALDIITESHGKELDLDKVALDDKKTYDMLSGGDTGGVFQLESDGMRELVKKLAPDRFDDIIALVALYRPGPLQSGMVDTYIDCKHGRKEPEYKHPIMKKLLEETYGIILYQEQAMEIAKELSGFDLSEADKLRKAMGKKKQDLMDEYRAKFIEGAKKHNKVDAKLSGEIFSLIEYFSGYGFNKSHSAAYALVTYHTAYLKANYPKEFMCALMTIESQNTDKIVRYIHECESMGLEVLPPDINASRSFFCVEDGKIRFGLSAVKGVGEKAVDSLVASREKEGKFTSLIHLCETAETRVMNKQVLEALIKCGSMDGFNRPRQQLYEAVPMALKLGGSLQKQRNSNQMNLFDFNEDEEQEAQNTEHLYPEVGEWNEQQKLKHEKETLGFYFSGHPLRKWSHYIEMMTRHHTGNIRAEMEGSVLLGGMIQSRREITIKKGKSKGRQMAHVVLEDFHGTCNIICFPDNFQKYGAHLVADKVIFVRGRMNKKKDSPEILADEIIPVAEAIEKMVQRVVIRLVDKPEDVVYELRKVCGNHRGDCKTLLEVQNNGYRAQIEIAEKHYLRPSAELFRQLEKLLGQKAVVCST